VTRDLTLGGKSQRKRRCVFGSIGSRLDVGDDSSAPTAAWLRRDQADASAGLAATLWEVVFTSSQPMEISFCGES
jgi:hypothetical protein